MRIEDYEADIFDNPPVALLFHSTIRAIIAETCRGIEQHYNSGIAAA
ncbi:unnamed protein product [Victoria cruziana]